MTPADDGMIVVDPHAFRPLWPALGIWLALFLTAGDGWNITRRYVTLELGRPAQAVIVDKRRHSGRNYVVFEAAGSRFSEPVGGGWKRIAVGQHTAVHVWNRWAFLDDDLGYSRWKALVFVGSFVMLWLWAIARYRFG